MKNALGNSIGGFPSPAITVNSGAGGDYAIVSGVISGGNFLEKAGAGLLRLTAANTFTGGLILDAGATQATDGVGLPAAGVLQFNGGVLLSEGPATFARPVGTSATSVNWRAAGGGGGFAANGGTLTVNLGGAAAPLTWAANSFVPTGKPLVFGAASANAETLFQNPINFGSAIREIRVDPGTGGDFASISGTLSGTGGLNKTGNGKLRLTGAGTYTGATTVTAGSLLINAASASATISVQSGAALGGSGTIAGRITAAAGGSINLVDGFPATLFISNPLATNTALTLGGNAGSLPTLLEFEVGATSDCLQITNAKFLVNPGGATINIIPISGFSPGVYDLIEFPAGNASGLANLQFPTAVYEGYTASLRTTDTAVQLVVIPEPATLGLLATASVALLLVRKRRQ